MSKVIFKMSFKHPNYKNTGSKNASHVKYIATRSGVDKSITEADVLKELNKEELESEPYARYINERPNSHGLFGQNGIENLDEIQEELKEAKGYVWRSVVSLKEEDAIKLGYTDKEKWQDMLRKNVYEISSQMGIGCTNLKWVGAIHMEKGHPHAHIMIWEKEPKRTTGVIPTKKIEAIRKHLIDDIFEEERMNIIQEKNAMRDLANEIGKKELSNIVNLFKSNDKSNLIDKIVEMNKSNSIYPKLTNEFEVTLLEGLKELGELMPNSGRVAYKFMPNDVKKYLNEITDYVFEKPEFFAVLMRNANATEKLARLYGSDTSYFNNIYSNAERVSMQVYKSLSKFGYGKQISEKVIFNLLRKEIKEEEINSILMRLNNCDIEKIEDNNKFDIALLKMFQTSYKNIDVIKLVNEYPGDQIEKESILNLIESYDSKEKIGYKELKSILNLTEKKNPIEEARNNTINDIKKRTAQMILKAAAEIRKVEKFQIDENRMNEAGNVIKSQVINNKINKSEEVIGVMQKLGDLLIQNNYEKEDAIAILNQFTIDNKLNSSYVENVTFENLNKSFIYSNLNNDMLIRKICGDSQNEAISNLEFRLSTVDNEEVKNRISDLVSIDILKKDEKGYSLTDHGVNSFLEVKKLDKYEKDILTLLMKNPIGFDKLIKELSYDKIFDKQIKNIMFSKYDLKIKEYFGSENLLNLKQLEKEIKDIYAPDDESQEKATKEYSYMEKRISNLYQNGYIDKVENGNMRINNDGIRELNKLSIDDQEFTRYDANIVLGYMDKMEGVLELEGLEKIIHIEINNKDADRINDWFFNAVESNDERILKYFIIEDGRLSVSKDGKITSFNLNKIDQLFKKYKSITRDNFKEICKTEYGENWSSEYNKLKKGIAREIKNGNLSINENSISLNDEARDLRELTYNLYKAGGQINLEEVTSILKTGIRNKDADKRYYYMKNRLESLHKQGYLSFQKNKYEINERGIEKRKNLLDPDREILKSKLEYLQEINVLDVKDGQYMVSEKYKQINENNQETSKDIQKEIFTKRDVELIDRMHNSIDIESLEKYNLRRIRGYKQEYEEIKVDYINVRDSLNIENIEEKVVINLSKILLMSGESPLRVLEKMSKWNKESNNNISYNELKSFIDKANETLNEDRAWGKTPMIYKKQWEEIFRKIGFKDEEIPKWAYKSEEWKELKPTGIVHKLWKGIWNELNKHQREIEIQSAKAKRMAQNLNKEARIEQYKKSLDGLYKEEELER